MRKAIAFALTATLVLTVGAGLASAGFKKGAKKKFRKGKVTMERCMAAATKVIPGQVAIVEFKSEDGYPVYEFEIIASDNSVWNVEVNAKTGHIQEIEKQVGPEDPAFKSQAKITLKQAEDIALSFMPGKIDRREYVIEPDGMAAYEFDIISVYGTEFKVEVEAATGKLHNIDPEHWEIGEVK